MMSVFLPIVYMYVANTPMEWRAHLIVEPPVGWTTLTWSQTLVNACLIIDIVFALTPVCRPEEQYALSHVWRITTVVHNTGNSTMRMKNFLITVVPMGISGFGGEFPQKPLLPYFR